MLSTNTMTLQYHLLMICGDTTWVAYKRWLYDDHYVPATSPLKTALRRTTVTVVVWLLRSVKCFCKLIRWPDQYLSIPPDDRFDGSHHRHHQHNQLTVISSVYRPAQAIRYCLLQCLHLSDIKMKFKSDVVMCYTSAQRMRVAEASLEFNRTGSNESISHRALFPSQ